MNTIVMLGGAAGSGKSSATRSLLSQNPGQAVRPSDSFLSLAEKRDIPLSEAFAAIPAEDAEDHFLALCAAHQLTVADQHFAVQPRRDSARAVGRCISDYTEEYVGTLSDRLLHELSRYNLILVLLESPADVLFRRAGERDGLLRRAVSIEDVRREIEAERREFDVAIRRVPAYSMVFDDPLTSTRDVVNAIEKLL